jgi:hypothetical protein
MNLSATELKLVADAMRMHPQGSPSCQPHHNSVTLANAGLSYCCCTAHCADMQQRAATTSTIAAAAAVAIVNAAATATAALARAPAVAEIAADARCVQR